MISRGVAHCMHGSRCEAVIFETKIPDASCLAIRAYRTWSDFSQCTNIIVSAIDVVKMHNLGEGFPVLIACSNVNSYIGFRYIYISYKFLGHVCVVICQGSAINWSHVLVTLQVKTLLAV